MADVEYFPIVVAGGGPVGELLSAYLSRIYKINHLVIERETSIPQDPRAFSLGDYSIRMLQNLGLHEKITTEFAQSRVFLNFIGGKHTDFHRKPFARMNMSSVGCTGHSKAFTFFQPDMEAHLRRLAKESGVGELRLGCEIVNIEEKEDEGLVYVTYEEIASKQKKTVKSSFLVGTDGRRGFTRKNYLEAKGVILEHSHPYKETFFGINWDVTVPTPESHPDFPLWRLGYTSEQVCDEFIPREFLFLCNPDRHGCSCRFGVINANPFHWRTEFSVAPGEDPEKMASENNAWETIMTYLTHSGSKYGLSDDIQFPIDCLKLRRTWYYQFEARQCNKWRVGRVMLAGDAAHIFPPFGGQGLQSGFFDAQGLAWRLALILKGHSPSSTSSTGSKPSDNYSPLLDSWVAERKDHIAKQLKFSMRNGSFLTEANPWKIFVRDWTIWFLSLSAEKKKQMEKIPLQPPQYLPNEEGHALGFLSQMKGGVYWWQVYCEVLKEASAASKANGHAVNGMNGHAIGAGKPAQGRICFTDDIIFTSWKKSLFQLVVLIESTDELPKINEELQKLPQTLQQRAQDSQRQSSTELANQLIQESTVIINDLYADYSSASKASESQTIARIATADTLLTSAPQLYTGPKGTKAAEYDPFALKAQQEGTTPFILLRPDRFVYARCKQAEELAEAVSKLEELTKPQSS